MMSVMKEVIEEECQQLVHHLDTLMRDRRAIHEEFIHLSELQKNLVVQLRSDSLSGEGKLHAFQVEKIRIEDRLEELEMQLQQKNDLVNELDSKASEYLLNVTTENNSVYDEEEFCDQNDANADIIQKLIFDEMTENDEMDGSNEESTSYGRLSATDEGSSTNNSGSITESCDNLLEQENPNVISESFVRVSLDQSPPSENNNRTSDSSISLSTDLENDHPTDEQMLSLTSILAELKTVKDEMGKCITNRDQSTVELEDQFLLTRQELVFLRETMNKMTDTMRWKESIDSLYQSSEKINVLNAEGSDDSDNDILDDDDDDTELTDELLCEALGKYGPDSHLGYSDKLTDDERSMTEMARLMSVSNRSSISASVSGKVAQLECQLKDSSEKLVKSNNKIAYLLKDRDSKRQQFKALQEKVLNMEAKMGELHGIFDGLATTIVAERNDLLKNLKQNSAYTIILESKLKTVQSLNTINEGEKVQEEIINRYKSLVTTLEGNVNKLQLENSSLCDELERIKDGNGQNAKIALGTSETSLHAKICQLESDKSSLNKKHKAAEIQVSTENTSKILDLEEKISELEVELKDKSDNEETVNKNLIEAKHTIRNKDVEINEMDEKIVSLQKEISGITVSFEEEISQLKHQNSQQSKYNLPEHPATSQKESIQFGQEHDAIVTAEENDSDNAITVCQIMPKQQKIEDPISENVDLIEKLKGKTDIYKEELNAREATIQELQITLTNNQKQSRENYQMLQDDMATLTAQSIKEKNETATIITSMEEKCIRLENDFQQKQEQYSSAMKELKCIQSSLKISDGDHNNVSDIQDQPGTSSMPDISFQSHVCESEKVICSLQEKIYGLEKLISNKGDSFDPPEVKMAEQISQDASATHLPLSRFESQLLEIKKLNDCLDTIKFELETSVNEFSSLKETIEVLKGEKKILEEGKSVVANLPCISVETFDTTHDTDNDDGTEEKKNFVNALQLKLNTISISFNDFNFDNVLNDSINKLKAFIEINLCNKENLKDKLISLTESIESEHRNPNINYNDMSCKILNLEKQNSLLSEEKLNLIEDYKVERSKTIEMERQMVSDLESLVLGLESEKKELISSLVLAQDRMQSLHDICMVSQEQQSNQTEMDILKGNISELEREKANLISTMEHTEGESIQKMANFKETHSTEMKSLKSDMTVEIDILEQQKDDILADLQQKVAKLNSEWTQKMNSTEMGYETQIREENARFGRILVEKNDEYEKLLEEKQIEVVGYQVRLVDLQVQLDEKLNLLDEFETNMEEILVVRDNLEEKLLTLQPPKQTPVSCPMLPDDAANSSNEHSENPLTSSSSTT